jgi:hypothetical protein
MNNRLTILAIFLTACFAGCVDPASQTGSARGSTHYLSESPRASKPEANASYIKPAPVAKKSHDIKHAPKIAAAKKPLKFDEPAGAAPAAKAKPRFEEPVEGGSSKKKPSFEEPADNK